MPNETAAERILNVVRRAWQEEVSRLIASHFQLEPLPASMPDWTVVAGLVLKELNDAHSK
jgi:hypothetical protein